MNFSFVVFIAGISVCLGKSARSLESVMLDQIHETQKNSSDKRSKPFTKSVQLYSRTSKKHIQIKGKVVDSLGKDGSADARIILESNSFGGRVYIRGEKSNRYLCFTKTGRLVARTKKGKSEMKRCIFKEVPNAGYFQYESVRHPNWYLAFGRYGRPKMGGATCGRPKCRLFQRRDFNKFASSPGYKRKTSVHPSSRRAERFLKLLKQQRRLILRL